MRAWLKERIAGVVIFVCAVAVATALYVFTTSSAMPWLEADPLAGNRLWRGALRLVQGRAGVLAGVSAAVAGGLLGAVVNRYFGWRVATAAVLVWTTMPWVWNGVALGRSSVCVASAVVAAGWVLNGVVLLVTWKARMLWLNPQEEDPAAEDVKRLMFISPREMAWVLLCAGGLFAFVSADSHDKHLGEAAEVYARGVVAEAAGRIIVLNGVADAQIQSLVGTAPEGRALRVDRSEACRTNLLAWARRTWPEGTNLWLAAQIGGDALVREAVRQFPERFYLMTGASTTVTNWWARWEAVAAHGKTSIDPFVPVMRRAFAYEGNTLGNALQAAGKLAEAWGVYWRIFTEIEPENAAAVVNLDEMLRRGYEVEDERREQIRMTRSTLSRRMGGVRVPAGRAWSREERRRMLVDGSNEMIAAYDAGDLGKAARIARVIVSSPEGHGFRPAFAVLGAALAQEGDYASSEICYRVAVEGAGEAEPRGAIFNDYADTLRHLGRFVEAERYARRAVREAGETAWLCKVTLAEVLRDAGKNDDEVRELVREALKSAPAKFHKQIRLVAERLGS